MDAGVNYARMEGPSALSWMSQVSIPYQMLLCTYLCPMLDNTPESNFEPVILNEKYVISWNVLKTVNVVVKSTKLAKHVMSNKSVATHVIHVDDDDDDDDNDDDDDDDDVNTSPSASPLGFPCSLVRIAPNSVCT